MAKKFVYRIYGLTVDNKVFYVGITSQKYLSQRKSEHIRDSREGRNKNPVKEKFIRQCLKQNKVIGIVELDQVENDIKKADMLEFWYIRNMTGLLNSTPKVSYSTRRAYHKDKYITGQQIKLSLV